MMYRLRFENFDQIYGSALLDDSIQIVLPLSEIKRHKEDGIIVSMISSGRLIAEIPSVLWEGNIDKCRRQLEELGVIGLKDALCENIGALNICNELGICAHGGMYLNIINSAAVSSYERFGAESLTLSFEMPFSKMKNIKSSVPVGAVIYGYLPLMKFRNCPAQNKDGCKGCSRDKYLVDRKNEKFRILCRNSQYSELLNCVPLYAADRSLPDLGFYELYFTVEDKIMCEKLFNMVINREIPDFRRTSGLYNRQIQ